MSKPCRPLGERLWERADRRRRHECWPWLGGKSTQGYGRIGAGGRKGRTLQAHRVAYELLIGPIPEGLELDHLCRRRWCVNPWHTEPVTHRENGIRGVAVEVRKARAARQTHCIRNHPLSGDNVRATKRQRHCRACSRVRDRRYREQRKAVA